MPLKILSSTEPVAGQSVMARRWYQFFTDLLRLVHTKITAPTPTTDNTVVRYDGTTGAVQASSVVISDAGTVNASKFWTFSATINDDAATSFTLAGVSEAAILTLVSGVSGYSGIVYVRVTSSVSSATLAVGASVNVTTGILAGTTGIDTKVTVSPHTDGKVYIENRTGGAAVFTITALGV